MFIDLTRHIGGRVLRVAVAAIVYLDACEGGTAVHLVDGQTLRVVEDPASIEALALPPMVACEVLSAPALTADAIVEAYVRITSASSPATSVPAPSPGQIDHHQETEGLRLAEDAGLISPADALEQRVEVVTRRRGRG